MKSFLLNSLLNLIGPFSVYLSTLILFSVLVTPCLVNATPLDDYVFAPDPNFEFTLVNSAFDWSTLTRGYTLDLTSQKWRSPSEVDRVLWKHWLTIIVPEWDIILGPTWDTALLLISDGNNTDPHPDFDPNIRQLAAGTRSVIIELSAIPNQPLLFTDESTSRIEDEIIAYSWDKYLNGGDANWPVQLPMVKSVVRAMDAVQDFVANDAVVTKTINNFVLTGGSKRGWTAWLTAAVDYRVTALAPIVSDLLNMKRSFAHHWAAYGFWADALAPYEELGIFEWFDTQQATELLQIVDPFEYLDRLDIPKFIINSAGDDFFVNDSIQFYIDNLPGETYLRHVPNTDHYLTGAFDDVFNSMAPYYDAFLNSDPRPQFSWTFNQDGSVSVQIIDTPKAVNLWQAANPNERDFRMITIGQTWTSSPLTDQGGGLYIAQVPEPQTGWIAFFVEMVFESPFQGTGQFDYHFTTEIRILPEILPFETDFDRNSYTDNLDLAILAKTWLTENAYRDIAPRRTGDNIVNFNDFALFGIHWNQ